MLHKNFTSFDTVEASVLKVLGYFDYFQFPLRKEQIKFYLGVKINDDAELDNALEGLKARNIIQELDGLFALNSIESKVSKRLDGEQRFEQMQARIQKSCARIRLFPFVRFIGLSGSMSKGYAPPGADIDFFIITQKNRVWICKIVLHAMKLLSRLKGSHHWYCLNYYIDDTALLIEEQNMFTAIEIASLKPLIDAGNYYEQFIQSNSVWLMAEQPNFVPHSKAQTLTAQPAWWASFISACSSNTLNKWVMNLTDGNWRKRKRRSKIPAEELNVVIKTRVNISKRHYRNYQKKMLDHLAQIDKAISTI